MFLLNHSVIHRSQRQIHNFYVGYSHCFFSDVLVLGRWCSCWSVAANMHLKPGEDTVYQGDYSYKRDNLQCLQCISEPWSPRPKPVKETLWRSHPLSWVPYSLILHTWVSASPEMSIQVQQVQTPPCSAQEWSRAILLSKTSMAWESNSLFGGS